ncbi:DUF4374 domain-containing protein [Rufibacter sp. H-1]|uniref:DUF4374 domain-containing protein n=2 Tax=Rufibacter sediminis TaxID=2762756 RepID=A0ABR6VUV1_9BACT|nr:DUF4374 domain-containing protein [Rufibacter sediminis]
MFSMIQAKKLALPVIGLCAALSFSSCSDDDNASPNSGPFVVSMAIQGSNNTFTYYTAPFSDVMGAPLTAEGKGIEQPGYFDFTQIGSTIYSIGGLDNVNVLGISKSATGELQQVGNTSFANSISDIIQADANTLVAVEMNATSNLVKFHTINANTVKVISTKQHPVSDLTTLSAPFYSGMRISGNHLFLSYYISNPSTFVTPYTDEAEIAVYSYPDLVFQKVIKDTRTGPVGGFNTKTGLTKDEQGNLYVLSNSNPANGYSQSTKKGAILRIANGQTTFDQNYFFDVEAATGGKNIGHLKYLSNGKALAEVNAEVNSTQKIWADGPYKTAIVDFNAKTVTYINGMPQHAGGGRRLAALQDGNFVYMAIPENNKVYVYKIDIQNHTATRGAEVQASFVAGFSKL